MSCEYWDEEIKTCRRSDVPKIAIPLDVSLDEAIRNVDFKVVRAIDLPEPKIENRWIPVTERLPEINDECLVTIKAGNYKPYVSIDQYFAYGWDDYGDDVVAWMPLPEPWKGDEE